jgi:hypothetical protein
MRTHYSPIRALVNSAAICGVVFGCSGFAEAQGQVVNGDFSAGNTGFTSDYGFGSASSTPGTYGVRTNSQDFNPGYNLFGDHTTGHGLMMLVDGSLSAGKAAWRQSISVQPNSQYNFSAWATPANSTSPAVLRFLINSNPLGPDFPLSTSAGQWQLFSASWNSGTNTVAQLSIVDTNLASLGNDFALDDLSFVQTSVVTNAPVLVSIFTAVEIGWNSETGKTYQVEYATAVNTNLWFALGAPVPGNGSTNYVFDSARVQPKRFYRVLTLN